MKRVHTIWNEFLVNSKYKVYRYNALAILLFFIILPMYMSDYGEQIPVSGYILISSITMLFYFALIFFTFKILNPKFLLRDKLSTYIVLVSVVILIMTSFQLFSSFYIEEYFNISHKTFYNGWERLLYLLVTYFVNGFFLMGFLVIILLRTWIIDSRRIHQLKKEQLESELKEIKSKINPDFFFNMLNKANVLAKVNPEKASEILLKLSHILRYQLYDSKRERVMLSSEILFMKDYLHLEKMRSCNFQFSINDKGNIHSVSIPALLFIPILEWAVKYVSTSVSVKERNIDIEITVNIDDLIFTCYVSKLTETNPFYEDKILYRRIGLIYGENFSVSISEEEKRYTTNIAIKYEK